MRVASLIFAAGAALGALYGAWLLLKGDEMDAFKCYKLAPEKFKARLEEEYKFVLYSPAPKSPITDVFLNLKGDLRFDANQLLTVYSNKADALVYRGKPIKVIKVAADDLLRSNGGGDNLKFQLYDQGKSTLCVCEQQTDYNIWSADHNVIFEFLSGRHLDVATETMRRFLVDGQ